MPSKSLPSSPNLDHLKYQAKDLLKAHKSGNSESLARIREFHPKFIRKPDQEIQAARFSLSDALFVVAREHGFESWPSIKQHVESLARRIAPSEPANTFFDAVRRADVERVRELLAQHPALVHARMVGDVRLLGGAQVGGDTDKSFASDENRAYTALHWATRYGHDELAKVLLEHNADADAVVWAGGEECAPIDLAAWEGTLQCVQMLLEHGADANRSSRRSQGSSALYTAAEHGARDKCEMLLRHGARPDIHSGAMLGLIDTLTRILDADPSLISSRDFRQRTPLDCALNFGQTKAAEFLIQRGASMNLVQAAGMGMLDRVRQFIESDPGAVNPADGSETPLMAAARNGNVEVIKLLLKHGADLHLGQKEYVHTIHPIHVARATAVPLLAAAGADLNQPYRGYTPLQRALSKHQQELALALARHRGTRRFYLVGNLHAELVEPLVNLGADLNETDEQGKTALDYALANCKRTASEAPAASKQFAALARVLREHGAKKGEKLQ